jgi:hypothetical protein
VLVRAEVGEVIRSAASIPKRSGGGWSALQELAYFTRPCGLTKSSFDRSQLGGQRDSRSGSD